MLTFDQLIEGKIYYSYLDHAFNITGPVPARIVFKRIDFPYRNNLCVEFITEDFQYLRFWIPENTISDYRYYEADEYAEQVFIQYELTKER